MSHSNFKIFSGTSFPSFSSKVASHLGANLGNVSLGVFPDGEISVQIMENVRGKDVFVVQSLAYNPNHYLMELVILVDALKRASAKSVVAVIPYFCYTRQDKLDKPRVPVTARLVANMLENAGVDRVLTMDLHSSQVHGFYTIPIDNLNPWSLYSKKFKSFGLKDYVVVAPDYGAIHRAYQFASCTSSPVACIYKQRFSASEVKGQQLIGHIRGSDVIIVDDICSTASTLVEAAALCRLNGAKKIYGAVSHGLFISDAVDKIRNSSMEKFFACNTVDWSSQNLEACAVIEDCDVTWLFASAIDCILNAKSISSIF